MPFLVYLIVFTLVDGLIRPLATGEPVAIASSWSYHWTVLQLALTDVTFQFLSVSSVIFAILAVLLCLCTIIEKNSGDRKRRYQDAADEPNLSFCAERKLSPRFLDTISITDKDSILRVVDCEDEDCVYIFSKEESESKVGYLYQKSLRRGDGTTKDGDARLLCTMELPKDDGVRNLFVKGAHFPEEIRMVGRYPRGTRGSIYDALTGSLKREDIFKDTFDLYPVQNLSVAEKKNHIIRHCETVAMIRYQALHANVPAMSSSHPYITLRNSLDIDVFRVDDSRHISRFRVDISECNYPDDWIRLVRSEAVGARVHKTHAFYSRGTKIFALWAAWLANVKTDPTWYVTSIDLHGPVLSKKNDKHGSLTEFSTTQTDVFTGQPYKEISRGNNYVVSPTNRIFESEEDPETVVIVCAEALWSNRYIPNDTPFAAAYYKSLRIVRFHVPTANMTQCHVVKFDELFSCVPRPPNFREISFCFSWIEVTARRNIFIRCSEAIFADRNTEPPSTREDLCIRLAENNHPFAVKDVHHLPIIHIRLPDHLPTLFAEFLGNGRVFARPLCDCVIGFGS